MKQHPVGLIRQRGHHRQRHHQSSSSSSFPCSLIAFVVWLFIATVQAFPPPTTAQSSSPFHQRQQQLLHQSESMTKPVKRSNNNNAAGGRSKNTQPFSSLYKRNNKNQALNLSILPLMENLSNPFWKALGTYAAADTVGFLISLATGSHVHLDLIGTGAFALVSLSHLFFSFLSSTTTPTTTLTLSQTVSSIAVSLWAIKLSAFLFYRATQVGHDLRLEETLSTVSGMVGFWIITFLWNVCCSLPYLLGFLSSASDERFVGIGSVVFGIGLIIETMADAQKWIFKQSPQNAGQFCNVGLWAVSQHPNFLGNLILWAGIFLMNVPAFLLPPAATSSTSILAQVWSYRRLTLALISPLFMWGLLNGQAQGVVTNASQLAASKYGSDPAYQQYLKDVPPIIPKLW